MNRITRIAFAVSLGALASCATLSGSAAGQGEDVTAEEQAAREQIGQKVKGQIVWSSSRVGNHDLFVMNTDGSDVRALTHSEQVDWFPRFSPDGERIMFTRSKKGWVYERDANRYEKWDIFTLPAAGGEPTLVAPDASWGTWQDDATILLSRGTKIFRRDLTSGEETLLVDSEGVADLGGADLQQPQLSPDGRYLALTLRGTKRATGIYDLEAGTWLQTGEGCQINWHPAGDRIYWVNPSGNGGSEVFSIPVKDGKPERDFQYEEMRFMDIPGRRSHEYFPQMTPDGAWLVWAATARGHDHDIADYEIYIWQVGAPAEQATRLTFHSGNDRWPHLFVHPAAATVP